MSCTVKYNTEGKIEKVTTQDGKISELFDKINQNVFVNSKEEAFEIHSNIHGNFSGKEDTLNYSNGEPKLFYSNNEGKVSEDLESILKTTNSGKITMNFKTSKRLLPVGEFQIETNKNTFQGLLMDSIKKGVLSAKKVLVDGVYKLQGKGGLDITKRTSAREFGENSAVFLGGNKVKVAKDGSIDIDYSFFSVTALNEDGTLEVIPKTALKDALKKKVYSNQTELALTEFIMNNEGREPFSKDKKPNKTDVKKVEKALYNFIEKMGFSVQAIEDYRKNYKDRVGEDPSIKALVDISNKVIAYSNGEISHEDLTEEVAHLAIEAFKDQESIEAILLQVVGTKEYQQFAEQYRTKYSNKYSGEALENMVNREILGKILANNLLSNFNTSGEVTLVSKLKELFSKFTNMLRSNFLPSSKQELNNIIENLVSAITTEELEQFSNEDLRHVDKVFFSLADNAEINIQRYLKEAKEVLVRSTITKDLDSLSKLEQLEEDFDVIDSLQITHRLATIMKKTVVEIQNAFEELEPGTPLSVEDRTKLDTVLLLKDGLENIKANLEVLDVSGTTQSEIKKDILAKVTLVSSVVTQLNEIAKDDSETTTKNLIDGLVYKGVDKEMVQKLHKEFAGNKKDISWMSSQFGLLNWFRNPKLAVLPKIVNDMFTKARHTTLTTINPIIKDLYDRGLEKYQKNIIKKKADGTNSHFLRSAIDFEKFEQAKVKESSELLLGLGISQEEIDGLGEDISTRRIKEIIGTEKLAIYKDGMNKWLTDNVESFINDDYKKARETTYAQLNINEDTQEVLKDKSMSLAIIRQKAMVDGKYDYNLLSENDKLEVETINAEYKKHKNAYNTKGEVKEGLIVKKLGDLTKEEIEQLGLSTSFVTDPKNKEREYMVENGDDIFLEGRIAYDLQKLDINYSNQRELEGDTEVIASEDFLDSLVKIENNGKSAFKWLVGNANIVMNSNYFSKFSEEESYTDKVTSYLSTLEDQEVKATKETQLKQYLEFVSARRNLLKQNKSTHDPLEINIEDMYEDVLPTIRGLDEKIDILKKRIGLPSEYYENSDFDAETTTNKAYTKRLEESGMDEIQFLKQHMSETNKFKVESYQADLVGYGMGKKSYLSRELNLFINNLEETGQLDSSWNYEQFQDFVISEFAKTKVASYFKKTTPNNYNDLIATLESGEIKSSDLVNNKEAIKRTHPQFSEVLDFIEVNPSYTWRKTSDENYTNPNFVEGAYRVQPKLSKYTDKEFFQRYGISESTFLNNPALKIQEMTATRNQDEFSLLQTVVDLRMKSIENKGDVQHVNPYLRPQISKQNLEQITALFGKGAGKTIKDVWTDIGQNKADDMMYGQQIDGEDVKLRIVPKYFDTRLENSNIVSDSVISSALLDYKESETYLARLNSVSHAIAVENSISKDKYIKAGSRGKTPVDGQNSKSYKSAQEYIDAMFFGKKENQSFYIGNKDITQVTRNISNYVRSLNLKYNPIVDLTSGTTGMLNVFIENMVGENWSKDAARKAIGIMGKEMPGYILESGKVNKTSNMNKLLELFGVEDIEERVQNSVFGRVGRLTGKSGYGFSKFMNMPVTPTVMVSVLSDYRFDGNKFLSEREFKLKMKTENPTTTANEITKQWKDLGSKTLYSYLDFSGESVTATEAFNNLFENPQQEFTTIINNTSSKISELTGKLDGIIGSSQKTAISRNAYASALGMHKDWLFLYMGKRYKNKQYNFMTGQVEEGHFTTVFKQGSDFYKALQKNKWNVAKSFKEVKEGADELTGNNLKRAMVDSLIHLAMFILGTVIVDSDDEDDSYLEQMSRLIYMRTLAEHSSTSIFSIKGLAQETIESPFAITGRFKNFFDMQSKLFQGEFDKAYIQGRKLIIPTNRYDKMTDLQKQYTDFLQYNESTLWTSRTPNRDR